MANVTLPKSLKTNRFLLVFELSALVEVKKKYGKVPSNMVLFAQMLRHHCWHRFCTKIGSKFDQKSSKNRPQNGVGRGIKRDEGFGCHKKWFDPSPTPRKTGWGGISGDMEMDKSRDLTRHWPKAWRILLWLTFRCVGSRGTSEVEGRPQFWGAILTFRCT